MSKPIRLYLLDYRPRHRAASASLAQRHLKLVLESGHRRTSPKRRAEIVQEIEAIRAERDSIIARLRKEAEVQGGP
ncbi:MAG: hypothetical protein C6W55_05160 [Thermobacillus sp.]|uniref:hypothetical protein n=1 Tax=Thermobacillus sp. TaxID=2108467 RepID=UPI000E361188|nr:hypothetical protein [Thermobacillus sp.]REK57351.1 MAG: hypothetical protein C6W55_05160 [Thermobacillus sp.]